MKSWPKAGRGMIAIYILAILMAAAWQFTPLREYARPEYLHRLSGALNEKWWAAPAVILIFSTTGLVMFPVTVLIAATILIFGGVKGGLYALLGSLMAAIVFYFVGKKLGLARIQKYETPRLAKWTGLLRKGGIGTVMIVRLLPVAPYTVANLICGALGIGVWIYTLGTLFALIPGIVTMALMRDQIFKAVTDFNGKTLATLVAVVIGSFGLIWLLQKYANKREASL